jgi:hypothetical protein
MSKPKCEVVSITGDHIHISLEPTQPVPFGLALDEIEHRIVQAYMRLVFRADNGRAPGQSPSPDPASSKSR